MAMTKEEKATKNWLYQHLLEEGYRTYAKLFWELDFHLTADPNVVGYMTPSNGTITVNRTLEADQVSVIIRHEILHGFLKHEKRLLQNLAQKRGLNYDELSDMDIKELKNYLYRNKNFNIAGDFEISNRAYTEEDKNIVRNILLNGKTVSGLVTEDHHKDWVDLSIEEMYDKLESMKPAEQPQQNNNQQEQGEDEGQESQGGENSQSTSQQSNNKGDRSQEGTGEGQENSDMNGENSQDGSEQSESSADEGEESNSSDDNSNNSSDNSNDSSSDSNSNSSSSDDDNARLGNNTGGKGSNAGVPKYVYGKFIDKHTFLDNNGNIIKIG